MEYRVAEKARPSCIARFSRISRPSEQLSVALPTNVRAVSYLEAMIKLSVMYPQTDDMKFDMDYYCQTHIPIVRRLIGEKLKGLSIDQAAVGADLPAPYAVIANLLFESVKTMQAALAEHGPVLMADIPNYTNAQPVIQVSETS